MWTRVSFVSKNLSKGLQWLVALRFYTDDDSTDPRELSFTCEPPLTDELLAVLALQGFDKLNAEAETDQTTIKPFEEFKPQPIVDAAIQERAKAQEVRLAEQAKADAAQAAAMIAAHVSTPDDAQPP